MRLFDPRVCEAPWREPSSLTSASGSDSGGGRTISCTKGVYWRQQGYGACDDVGTTGNEGRQFRLSDGTVVTNSTDSIQRGFKAGYNIMQTAARGSGDGGAGYVFTAPVPF